MKLPLTEAVSLNVKSKSHDLNIKTKIILILNKSNTRGAPKIRNKTKPQKHRHPSGFLDTQQMLRELRGHSSAVQSFRRC